MIMETPLDPRLARLPRMGPAGPYVSTSVLRPPAPPCASVDRRALAPAEAQRIRCAAVLMALLGTVALQAGAAGLAPGLAAPARFGSLAAGLVSTLAALPLLVAARRRWPFPDVY